MTQDELAIIAGAKHRIETVLSTNEGFLENARSHATPRDVPTKLEFDGDSVIVEIFGHKAFSSSRVVRAGNDFYMEYQFVVRFNEEDNELTRFYVGGGGLVYLDLESETTIDLNSTRMNSSHVAIS